MQKLIKIFKVKASFNYYFFILMFIVFLLLLGAYIYNNNIIYLLVFLIFSLGCSNEFFARLNIYKVEIQFVPKERLFANTKGTLWLAMKNYGNNTSYALKFNSQTIDYLEAKKIKFLKLDYLPLKRGLFQIPEFNLESTFPLPHLKVTKKIKTFGHFTVYPKPFGKTLEESFAIKSFQKNGYDEFDGIKDYIEGEPLSRLHWASYAKHDKWMSKDFLEEISKKELLLKYKNAGDCHESRLSQLCFWILECEKQNIEFYLEFNDKLYYSKNDGIDFILEELANA